MTPTATVSWPALDFPSSRGDRLPFGGEALVSVVIPTRNRRELLARALHSVLQQSYPNLEVLVIDDLSDDGSAEMVAALGDPRVRWLPNDSRRGAGYSRHRGAELSRGRYIAFLDSDDGWLRDKLWVQLEAAERLDAGALVIIGPPVCDDGLGLGLGLDEQPVLRPGQPIADYVYTGRQATVLSSCLLVSGDLGRRVRFDPSLTVNQDTDYLLQLERAGASFHCIEQPLYILDTTRRADRITYDRRLLEASRQWYAQVSRSWSYKARRGYRVWDLSVRYANNGRRWLGLWYFITGFSLEPGPYKMARQLLRVLGGGEVPLFIKRLHRLGPWLLGPRWRPPPAPPPAPAPLDAAAALQSR